MRLDEEIADLIQRIDQSPDKLHSEYTPAVHRLIEIGKPALPSVLALMLDENRDKRMRALRVIEALTMKHCGFRSGQGWPCPEDERAWRRKWDDMGSLDPDAHLSKRTESVTKWMHSLNTQAQPHEST